MSMRSDTCMKRSRFGGGEPGLVVAALAFCLLLGACHDRSGANAVPGDADDHHPWNGIAAGEGVRIAGTEPFWSAEIRGEVLTYRTPERPDGEQGRVSRFAGRGGLSYSGEFKGGAGGQPARTFTLAIGPGPCSDGMSGKRYPFSAMLKIDDDVRKGCASSDRAPIAGAAS